MTDFIREQQTAEYDEQMMVTDDEVAEEQASSEDELFDDALNFVVDQQKLVHHCYSATSESVTIGQLA